MSTTTNLWPGALPMAKPSWCVKPSPCDFDVNSSYCPHRECRANLITTYNTFIAIKGMDVYVCGCEFPTDTGQLRHYQLRCPTCTMSGGAGENLDETD